MVLKKLALFAEEFGVLVFNVAFINIFRQLRLNRLQTSSPIPNLCSKNLLLFIKFFRRLVDNCNFVRHCAEFSRHYVEVIRRLQRFSLILMQQILDLLLISQRLVPVKPNIPVNGLIDWLIDLNITRFISFFLSLSEFDNFICSYIVLFTPTNPSSVQNLPLARIKNTARLAVRVALVIVEISTTFCKGLDHNIKQTSYSLSYTCCSMWASGCCFSGSSSPSSPSSSSST